MKRQDDGKALSGVKYSGTGWRNATQAEFEREKDILIGRGMPYWIDPDNNDMPRYTLDECAFLVSVYEGRDKDHILSKMQLCKDEARALDKIRSALGKRFSIRSLDDVLDTTRYRETGKIE